MVAGLVIRGLVKGAAKLLTKGEKSVRKLTKSRIRENLRDRDIGFSQMKAEARGIFSKQPPKTKAQIQKATRKFESARRKSLRSDLRDLGKVVGDKEAAKFAQKAESSGFIKPKIFKVKPRARIKPKKQK